MEALGILFGILVGIVVLFVGPAAIVIAAIAMRRSKETRRLLEDARFSAATLRGDLDKLRHRVQSLESVTAAAPPPAIAPAAAPRPVPPAPAPVAVARSAAVPEAIHARPRAIPVEAPARPVGILPSPSQQSLRLIDLS